MKFDIEKAKKDLTITRQQLEYCDSHIFVYFKNGFNPRIYYLFSEDMPMLRPYLQRKAKEHASLSEILRYCSIHNIKVRPYAYSKHFTKLHQKREEAGIRRLGLQIDSTLSKLVEEYACYMTVMLYECIEEAKNARYEQKVQD